MFYVDPAFGLPYTINLCVKESGKYQGISDAWRVVSLHLVLDSRHNYLSVKRGDVIYVCLFVDYVVIVYDCFVVVLFCDSCIVVVIVSCGSG